MSSVDNNKTMGQVFIEFCKHRELPVVELVETDVVRLPAFKYIYVKLEMSNGFLSVYLYVQVSSFVYTNEIKDGRLKSMCKKAFSDW